MHQVNQANITKTTFLMLTDTIFQLELAEKDALILHYSDPQPTQKFKSVQKWL